jgi:hypothetical protein
MPSIGRAPQHAFDRPSTAAMPSGADRCSWCDRAVDREDGWRLHESPGGGYAVFCRLEHVVPWSIQGARWDAERPERAEEPPAPEPCAECGMAPGGEWLALVRHRDGHRIQDCFCSIEHLAGWAKAGGRWR